MRRFWKIPPVGQHMFNRMIDVNEIASVILDNGLAFSVN